MKTLLVIMAHPDDAELLCYGTIKKYEERGYSCHLVIATKGELATVNRSCVDRISESNKAFRNTNVKISCLNFPDGFLTQDHTLMSAVQKQIELINPNVIITHYPDDNGLEHQDHNELAKATFSIAVRYGCNLRKLLFAEPLFRNILSFQPNLYINIDKYFEEKIDIIKCHASQIHKFYTNEKFIEMRARSMSPYLNIDSGRFNGKYELFQQAFAIDDIEPYS